MRRRPSQLRRLAPCAAATIAVHAAVLALPVMPAAQAHGQGARVHALGVRMLPAPVTTTREAAAVPTAAGAISPSDVRAAIGDDAPPRIPRVARASLAAPMAPWVAPPVDMGASDERPDEHADRPTNDTADVADETVAADTLPQPGRDGIDAVIDSPAWGLSRTATEDDAFVARALLAVAPQPLDTVIVPVPTSLRVGEVHRGELTLFIDETGTVVRVRAETDTLPDELVELARQAFMAARFAPGELTDAGAVKSRIRVEVVFDGGADPEPPLR